MVLLYRNRWRDSRVRSERKNPQFGSTVGNGMEGCEQSDDPLSQFLNEKLDAITTSI
jgi:hypothetical protein